MLQGEAVAGSQASEKAVVGVVLVREGVETVGKTGGPESESYFGQLLSLILSSFVTFNKT